MKAFQGAEALARAASDAHAAGDAVTAGENMTRVAMLEAQGARLARATKNLLGVANRVEPIARYANRGLGAYFTGQGAIGTAQAAANTGLLHKDPAKYVGSVLTNGVMTALGLHGLREGNPGGEQFVTPDGETHYLAGRYGDTAVLKHVETGAITKQPFATLTKESPIAPPTPHPGDAAPATDTLSPADAPAPRQADTDLPPTGAPLPEDRSRPSSGASYADPNAPREIILSGLVAKKDGTQHQVVGIADPSFPSIMDPRNGSVTKYPAEKLTPISSEPTHDFTDNVGNQTPVYRVPGKGSDLKPWVVDAQGNGTFVPADRLVERPPAASPVTDAYNAPAYEDIPAKRIDYTPDEIAHMCELYDHHGYSAADIAEKYNVAPATIVRKLRDAGKTLRSPSERASNRLIMKGETGGRGKRGTHTSTLTGESVPYSSTLENRYMENLDNDENVADWRRADQPVPYEFEGTVHHYVPDFYVKYKDGREVIVEVKPHKDITDARVQAKAAAASTSCNEQGMEFRFVAQRELGIPVSPSRDLKVDMPARPVPESAGQDAHVPAGMLVEPRDFVPGTAAEKIATDVFFHHQQLAAGLGLRAPSLAIRDLFKSDALERLTSLVGKTVLSRGLLDKAVVFDEALPDDYAAATRTYTLPDGRRDVEIRLNPRLKIDPDALVFNLAHEAAHASQILRCVNVGEQETRRQNKLEEWADKAAERIVGYKKPPRLAPVTRPRPERAGAPRSNDMVTRP